MQCSHEAEVALVGERSNNEPSLSPEVLVSVSILGVAHPRKTIIDLLVPVVSQSFRPIKACTVNEACIVLANVTVFECIFLLFHVISVLFLFLKIAYDGNFIFC